jgi:thymidine phosphorylase
MCSYEEEIPAPVTGYITRCDALTIGVVATRLGAGRERKEDSVDSGVGITLEVKVGDRVEAGQTLARVHYNDTARWEAQKESLASAWSIDGSAPPAQPLVLERIDPDS